MARHGVITAAWSQDAIDRHKEGCDGCPIPEPLFDAVERTR